MRPLGAHLRTNGSLTPQVLKCGLLRQGKGAKNTATDAGDRGGDGRMSKWHTHSGREEPSRVEPDRREGTSIIIQGGSVG